MKKVLLIAMIVSGAVASQASFTLATNTDPSPSGATPLFAWDQGNNTLSGSWTGNGLDLQTPGFIGGGVVNNAHFVMNSVALTVVIPNVLYMMGAGTVNYYTNDVNNPFFTITFSGGTFLNPFTAGASQINGNVIAFSGPNVPSPLTNQQFSYSFANPVTNGGVTSYTSAFTSSADIVPEPVSMIALGTGLVALVSRRKKKA